MTIVLTAVITFILRRWTSLARDLLVTLEGVAFVSAFNAIEHHHLNPANAATPASGAARFAERTRRAETSSHQNPVPAVRKSCEMIR
jgi:hypothetical protein